MARSLSRPTLNPNYRPRLDRDQRLHRAIIAPATIREMPSASLIAHAGLPFAKPRSEAAIDAAVAMLPLGSGTTVAETGCGNGEILRRTVRVHPGTRGLGIDLDPEVIALARG